MQSGKMMQFLVKIATKFNLTVMSSENFLGCISSPLMVPLNCNAALVRE